jgi:DNA (cytosine-5)-methyltransferase 1
MLKFGSVCSGIEAASVAWHPLGWTAAWVAEIEKFPSAVLAHHYPEVPNLGDMTDLPESIALGLVEAPDVLCGGTPCQAFSVAGLRRSLDDARGNLSLVFCEIANAIDAARLDADLDPAIIFWENVPGVLSTKDNAFGCFLAGLAGEDDPLDPPGGKWAYAGVVSGPARTVAWRVLDAQYFGVAQRRRRVFVVASARADFDPVAVLFEFDGLRRDTAPSRKAGQSTAHSTAPCLTSSGRGVSRTGDTRGQDPVVACRVAAYGGGNQAGEIEVATARNACASPKGRLDFESETFLVVPETAHTLRGEGFDGSKDGTGRGTPLVPVLPFDTTQITHAANRSNPKAGDPCHPLAAGAHAPCVAYTTKLHNTTSNNAGKLFEERTACLDANSPPPALLTATQVRRPTPTECERLQGFPDGYTQIAWRGKAAADCPDGPRYKALGNSWAVPVVRWIGDRINSQLLDNLL